jgi:chemotaxis signal transduction protein
MIQKTQSLRVTQVESGGQTYCLDSSSVVDVVPVSRMQCCNSTTTAKVGTVAAGQDVHSVYSLEHQLGQLGRGRATGNEDVILLKSSLGPLAVLVDQVKPQKDMSVSRAVPVPSVLQAAPHNVCEAVVFLRDFSPSQGPLESELHDSVMVFLLSTDLLHARIEGRLSGTQRTRPSCASSLMRNGHAVVNSNSAIGAQLGKRRASLVVFSIGAEMQAPSLALSITQVVEICRLSSCLPIPAAPSNVMGLFNWRDQPAVVVDLATVLGLAKRPAQSVSRLLVARVTAGKADLVAFPIDTGSKVVPVPAKSRAGHAPAGCRADLLCGSFEVEGQNLLVPDMSRVLADL